MNQWIDRSHSEHDAQDDEQEDDHMKPDEKSEQELCWEFNLQNVKNRQFADFVQGTSSKMGARCSGMITYVSDTCRCGCPRRWRGPPQLPDLEQGQFLDNVENMGTSPYSGSSSNSPPYDVLPQTSPGGGSTCRSCGSNGSKED